MGQRAFNGTRVRAAGRAVALASALAVVGVAGAAAQATPASGIMADPASGPCEAPEGMAGMDMGSPMAGMEMGATPAADAAAPIGTPVEDGAEADAALAAAENFANCWTAGDADAVLALGTANYVATQYGLDAAEADAELAAETAFPPISILEVGDAQTFDDGRVSLDLVYLLGEYQYTNARWYFVDADGQLLLDQQDLLLPQPDVESSTVIGVTFADDDSAVAHDAGADPETGGRSLTPFPAVILNLKNNGTAPRLLSVVQVADEAGTPVAAGGEFVAQVSLPASAQEAVALVNLDPGSYELGEPGGEAIPLTIAEPEA